MTSFIWAIVGITALECLGKIYTLATGKQPERTPVTESMELIGDMLLIVWGAILLSK